MRALNLTVKELCDVVEGATALDHGYLIKHIAALETAQKTDLAVLFDPEDASVFLPLTKEKVEKSEAGLIMASKAVVPGKNYLLVQDPLGALGKLAAFIDQRKTKGKRGVSDLASVGEFAVIEDDVEVGPYAVIEDDAKVGKGATIGAQAFVGKNTQIGCGVKVCPGARILEGSVVGDYSIIHTGVVIGSDGFGYRVMKQGLRKIPHIGIVKIGKQVEIGANTCIDRAEFEETVVGDGVKIDNNVHIAHNVHVGQGTAILAQTGIAGSARIGVGCQIGGQVAIRDHITIGDYAKIVSKSAVMRDVKSGETICGIPAVSFSDWKRTMVVLSKLPEMFKGFKEMQKYFDAKRKGGILRRLLKR